MPVAYESISAKAQIDWPATTLTITKPAGVVQGEFLLGLVVGNEVSWSPPSGFNVIYDVGHTASAFLRTLVVWKATGASEPATYDFTRTSPNDAAVGALVRFSGVNLSSPYVSARTEFETAIENPSTLVCPSVNVAVTNSLLLRIAMVPGPPTSLTHTGPAGYTERADYEYIGSQNNKGFAFYVKDALVAIGASGTENISANYGGMKRGHAITLSLSPVSVEVSQFAGRRGSLGQRRYD